MRLQEIEVIQGSREYLYADIRADRTLNTQVIELSISPVNTPMSWTPATWVGQAGKFRAAQIMLDGTLVPDLYYVFARITDSPEVPIIAVGRLRVV